MGHVVQIFSTHNAWNRESARKGTRIPLAKKHVVMLTGTPEYRHRQTRIFVDPKMQPVVDNQWIVPYNHLVNKYHAHINVETCSSISVVKYLCKYVYKGPDRATTVVERQADMLGQENNA
jgi:hypothetical protein